MQNIHKSPGTGLTVIHLVNRPYFPFDGRIAKVYTVSQKKGYHPTTNDNFNNSCTNPVIFGTNITE